MYKVIYEKNGEIRSIEKQLENSVLSFDVDSGYYQQYLVDAENGVEVIDNPPTQAEIDKSIALEELNKTDSIPRFIEDIYDILSDDQKLNLVTETKNKILNKKAKRQAYKDLL